MNNTNNTPYGYCYCGCGQKTKLSRYTSTELGWIKGEPRFFIQGHQFRGKTPKDLTGQKFGRWLVVSFSHQTSHRSNYWNCRCDCGNERPVQINHLRSGKNQSCGCLQKELAAQKKYKHGLSYHPLKSTYHAMKTRCYVKDSPEYHNYGGRGIVMCDRWLESLKNFIDDMGERPDGYSLDRIDNNGPYGPENCRWATNTEQANNKRTNRVIEWNGKSQSINAWAQETGISPRTIYSRLRYGWNIEQIFNTPIDTRCHKKSQV